jgi:hypothetical protein
MKMSMILLLLLLLLLLIIKIIIAEAVILPEGCRHSHNALYIWIKNILRQNATAIKMCELLISIFDMMICLTQRKSQIGTKGL